MESFPGLQPGATPTEPQLITACQGNVQVLAEQVIALTNRVNELTAELNRLTGKPAATGEKTDTKPEAKTAAKK